MTQCDTIREYLGIMQGVRMSTVSGDIETCESLLLKHARKGPKPLRCKAKRMGEPGDCYRTAMVGALSMYNDRGMIGKYRETVRYVEGMSLNIIPMWHGWIEHANGTGVSLIETVWDEPGDEYFGIAWHPEVARDAMLELGWGGILPNLWAAGKKIGNVEKWIEKKLQDNRDALAT